MSFCWRQRKLALHLVCMRAIAPPSLQDSGDGQPEALGLVPHLLDLVPDAGSTRFPFPQLATERGVDPEAVPLGLEDDWEAQLEELGGSENAAAAVDELRRPGYDPALADKVLAMEDKVRCWEMACWRGGGRRVAWRVQGREVPWRAEGEGGGPWNCGCGVRCLLGAANPGGCGALLPWEAANACQFLHALHI